MCPIVPLLLMIIGIGGPDYNDDGIGYGRVVVYRRIINQSNGNEPHQSLTGHNGYGHAV
jgi:Ni,Fe-hydrogenase maturation factor